MKQIQTSISSNALRHTLSNWLNNNLNCYEKGKPLAQMVDSNGLKLPIAKSKFTVNKKGMLLVKEKNEMDEAQLKLYDKQTGTLREYNKRLYESD